MPTPSGEKSVQDAIDVGMPHVVASGIQSVTRHQLGCYRYPRCTCGLEATYRRLAIDIDEVLERFGLADKDTQDA
jgi:hypothetical protein